MVDWNGNGQIDPIDIGISIAVENDSRNDTEADCEDDKFAKASRNNRQICHVFLEWIRRIFRL